MTKAVLNRWPERTLVLVLASLLLLASAASTLAPKSAVLAQQQSEDEVRLELNHNGFTPSEVEHAPGTFGLAVENTVLGSEYTLRLAAEDGTVLREVQVQKGSSAWSVTLPAGNYRLTEAGNPQWLCRITIK